MSDVDPVLTQHSPNSSCSLSADKSSPVTSPGNSVTAGGLGWSPSADSYFVLEPSGAAARGTRVGLSALSATQRRTITDVPGGPPRQTDVLRTISNSPTAPVLIPANFRHASTDMHARVGITASADTDGLISIDPWSSCHATTPVPFSHVVLTMS